MSKNKDYLTLANERHQDNRRARRNKQISAYKIAKLNADTKKALQEQKLEFQQYQAKQKAKHSILITLISVISFIGLLVICLLAGSGKI